MYMYKHIQIFIILFYMKKIYMKFIFVLSSNIYHKYVRGSILYLSTRDYLHLYIYGTNESL